MRFTSGQECGHRQISQVILAEPRDVYSMGKLAGVYGVGIRVFVNNDATELARAASLYGTANYDPDGGGPCPSTLIGEAINAQMCGSFVVGLTAETTDVCAFDVVDEFRRAATQFATSFN